MDVGGARIVPLHTTEDLLRVLRKGEEQKHIAATAMNERSSRAHTVLTLHFVQRSTRHPSQVLQSCLKMVDLAGSERVSLHTRLHTCLCTHLHAYLHTCI